MKLWDLKLISVSSSLYGESGGGRPLSFYINGLFSKSSMLPRSQLSLSDSAPSIYMDKNLCLNVCFTSFSLDDCILSEWPK